MAPNGVKVTAGLRVLSRFLARNLAAELIRDGDAEMRLILSRQ